MMNIIRNPKRYKDQGFTLVELLVVMIIIGILAAIAIPIFMSQQKSARDTTLTSDVKNAAMVAQTALADYKSWDAMSEAIDNTSTTIFVNRDAGVNKEHKPSYKYWNESGELPEITADPGSHIEIVHIIRDIPVSDWIAHDDTEFCIFSPHSGGKKYNWKSLQFAEAELPFTHVLFYDPRLGGVKNIEDIADAVRGMSPEEASEVSSCHGYGLRHIKAVALGG